MPLLKMPSLKKHTSIEQHLLSLSFGGIDSEKHSQDIDITHLNQLSGILGEENGGQTDVE